MSTRPDDEPIDGAGDAEPWARLVEGHLDHHPLPVDEAEVAEVVRRLHRRMARRPDRSRWWAVGAVALALAAAALIAVEPWHGATLARPPAGEVEGAQVDDGPAPVPLVEPPAPDPGDPGLPTIVPRPGAVVLTERVGPVDVVLVVRGEVEADHATVSQGRWVLATRGADGSPVTAVFRDGEAPPPLPAAVWGAGVGRGLERVRWRALPERTLAAVADAGPEDLLARLPDAELDLDGCANDHSGLCAPEVGVQAAFAVAVGRYVQTGVADGVVSATVRALDPGRFAALPDVLTAAATKPQSWAMPWYERPRPEPGPVVPMREYRGTLEVRIVDPDGKVLPDSMVRYWDEREDHIVNTVTGCFFSQVRYLPDGTERYFHKGDAIRIEAFAVDHAYQTVEVVLESHRRNRVTITLAPESYPVPPAAPPVATDAIAALGRWREATRPLRDPTGWSLRTMPTIRREREATARLAHDWELAGGGATAHALCLSTGMTSICAP